jgi:hypothetical protein
MVLNRSRGVKKRSRNEPNLVLDLTFLPARRRRAGDRIDEVNDCTSAGSGN